MTTDPNHHLSDAELGAMTAELDEMHQDQAMPAMRRAIADWVGSLKEARQGVDARTPSRRTFLLGAAGLGAGGVVLAACGSSAHSTANPTTLPPTTTSPTSSGSSGALTGDLAVAAIAASLENLGVYAYKAGLKAATAGSWARSLRRWPPSPRPPWRNTSIMPRPGMRP